MRDCFWRLEHDDLGAALRRGDLSLYELRTYLALAALTIGFGKKADMVSAGQITKMTGIGREHVHHALRQLAAKGLAKSESVGPREVRRSVTWPAPSASPGTNAPHGSSARPGASAGTTIKDTKIKNNNVAAAKQPHRTSKKKLKVHPDSKAFLAEWDRQYLEVFGVSYLRSSWSKEMAQATSLLSARNMAALTPLVRAFLQSNGQITKTVGTFLAFGLNKVEQDRARPAASEPTGRVFR
jgi:phage replication O-like protein O